MTLKHFCCGEIPGEVIKHFFKEQDYQEYKYSEMFKLYKNCIACKRYLDEHAYNAFKIEPENIEIHDKLNNILSNSEEKLCQFYYPGKEKYHLGRIRLEVQKWFKDREDKTGFGLFIEFLDDFYHKEVEKVGAPFKACERCKKLLPKEEVHCVKTNDRPTEGEYLCDPCYLNLLLE